MLYFIYRYFLRLGFLDGWQGLAFHFLQGFWYRFLVNVKIHELETLMQAQGLGLEEAVRREFGFEIGAEIHGEQSGQREEPAHAA